MYKRDHDAEVRGKKALEKVKVHRNYQEMLKQLPLLQRQERIAAVNQDKPLYHMSDERIKEVEAKKQNRMENAYEQLFPAPNVITLPPVTHRKNDRYIWIS